MRLITRGDADGLCCAVFLRIKEKIDAIEFIHPKDMQDGKIEITPNDIIANLPYRPTCGMWFDHHASSGESAVRNKFKGKFRVAPSAARVVYEYYNDPELNKYSKLLEETDKVDSAHLQISDVTDPHGYVLLMYTLDPRSGLGPFKEYFLRLMDWIIEKPIDDILQIPEVKERCDRLLREQDEFAEVMRANSHLEGNVIVTDLRKVQKIPVGNRFLIFTLFPEGNVQIRVFNGKGGEFIVAALGTSIFNRTCRISVGDLCIKYGGGGHKGAATVQLSHDNADKIVTELIAYLRK